MKKTLVLFSLLAAAVLLFSSCSFADSPVRTEGVVIPLVNGGSFQVPVNDATALVRDMKAGWNLGNTFDAYDDEGWFKGTGAAMETAWVGVKTTPELIDTVKNAGFNTLRLPVSWHNHVDENFRINREWLARVREVADYALSRGMYVIVNVHHDNWENWFYPDNAHYEKSAAFLKAVWQQIAEAFADCDDHLIIESMNEPRLTGTSHEWSWDPEDPSCREAADCINRLNQLFVDTVRAAGGNNADRFLMIPGYDAAPWYVTDPAFVLPKDTVKDRLIISAHAYTPYPFALQPDSGDSVFTLDAAGEEKRNEITGFLDGLYWTFVASGVPVVMDEFGAVDRNGNLQDRVNFAAWYVSAAAARGIACCWWDNHIFSGVGNEPFGLIDRKTCKWVCPDIVLAMMSNCISSR